MDAERWRKIKTILETALETAPESRAAFLREACGGDDELRREVENLLEFEQSGTDIFEQQAIFSVLKPGIGGVNQIGRQIGNYKITGELGAGGMGAVFLAERADGEFHQKAAVKIVKNSLNSETISRRFLMERQILASLEHPNITRLIDGGRTSENLPYFVMEYVEGAPITEYANANNLNLEARLELFREVCAAVSFAHQKLIIHRDLKPSNVLVTGEGKVKLLDFGIAKLQTPENGGETRTQAIAFTPEYASPEQIRGETLSTATDVYSLGVILYELLTGSRPFSFENKNFGEIIQTATRSEPPVPSLREKEKKRRGGEEEQKTNFSSPSLLFSSSELKGDLDNIILKSLKKEPERRYQSVEQFSEDIRRYLEGLPVTARRDTLRYRGEKFVRRNPLVVTATLMTFLILIGGIVAVWQQARIAEREREKAERRFNDVRRLANSFMFEINEEIERSPIRARELLVQRAIEYLDKLASEAAGNAGLQSELAAAYEKIGSVQSELFKPTLGKTSDALVSHQKSLEIRQTLFSAEPTDIKRGLEVVKSRQMVGDIFSMSGRVGEARESYAQAIELCQKLLALDGENVEVRRNLARSFARRGQSILRSGSLADTLADYEKSLEIYQNLLAENPSDESLERAVGILYSYISYVKIETNQTAEAVRYAADSLAITEKRADRDNSLLQSGLADKLMWLGVALSENGEYEKSRARIEKALEIQNRLFAADKKNIGEQNGVADCYLELGKSAVKFSKPDEAVKNLEKAIENYDAVWQADRQNYSARRQIAFAQIHLGDAFRQKRDTAKALEIYEKSLAALKELTALDANNTEWQDDLAAVHLRLGEIALEKNDRGAARQNLEIARPIFEKLAAQSPEHAKRRANLETVKILLAKLPA